MRKSPGSPLHRVTLCRYASPEKRTMTDENGRPIGGGRRKLWAFSYGDLSVLFDLPAVKVRAAVRAGKVDPRDLDSVADYWHRSTCQAVKP